MRESDRFRATLRGGVADRFPFFDLEAEEVALQEWRRQGLPADRSVAEVFGLEVHHLVDVDLRSRPRFVGSALGLRDTTLRERHYDPGDPSRYGEGWVERARAAASRGQTVCADAWGGGLLQMLGVGDWASLSATLCAMVEEPAALATLVNQIADTYCACLGRMLTRVQVDFVTLYEPIASNTGPIISPLLFRRLTLPGYRKVLRLLERHGVPLRILCSTGGDLSALLPDLIEAGINGLWLSNTRAPEMDYQHLRRRFGPKLALIGGIAAQALHGDEDSVRRAVGETVPPLLQQGRYLPCLSDRPRSGMPYANYRLYRELLRDLALHK